MGRVQRSRNAQKRWAQCEVLVIDEISMMEAALFDKLNTVGQRCGRGLLFCFVVVFPSEVCALWCASCGAGCVGDCGEPR